MSVDHSIGFPLWLTVLVLASSALIGCTDAPDDIKAVSGSTAPWVTPDTVAVLVMGTPVAGDLRWMPPNPAQKAWLAEHGFDRINTRYSEAETEELWAERLRTLRGLIGEEHIPEIRQSVVQELSLEAVGRDELLRIDISDGFNAERFQQRLEEVLRLQGATREEVQTKLNAIETALEDYKDQHVLGRAYYAREE